MHKLIEFIRSTYVFVLFVVLEALAINNYAHGTHYTQARLLSRSNRVVGGLHGMMAGVRHYLLLGSENRELLDYVAQLTERLAEYEDAVSEPTLETVVDEEQKLKYRVMHASVVSNTINRAENLIVLNRGRLDGVTEEMTLLSPEGAMVGYVVDCTDRYSVAVSVLNTSFRVSGKLKDTEYFGSVYWDGTDPHVVTLDELSKYADPQPGQEVVTTGFSRFFPGVKIGVIESSVMNETRTFYTVKVRLEAHISRLSDVLLVEKRDLYEIRDLMDGVREGKSNWN